MARFVAVIDRAGRVDLGERLADAERAMTRGGTREHAHRLVRPPFALLVLTHDGTHEPWSEVEGALHFFGGFGPATGDGGEKDSAPKTLADFVIACGAALEGDRPLPPQPLEAFGRRALGAWHDSDQSLELVTEPNGHRPLFVAESGSLTVLATEPKGIWGALGGTAGADADALAQLWTLGHCLAPHALLAEARATEPGAAYRFARECVTVARWPAARFTDDHRADRDALAELVNQTLMEVLGGYEVAAGAVALGISGGMDSRYVLAGACAVWSDVATYTFGAPESSDVRLATAIAARAGVPNHRHAPSRDTSFLARWAPYAVWRADGMLSCIHAHGMDATIAEGATRRLVLNGIGGDLLMGAFLRPSHLLEPADPARARRFVLASRRFHADPLETILKPEVLERRTRAVDELLDQALAGASSRRLGNMLTHYWLRHYAPRITTVGLMLEEPWVEFVGPLIDPRFVVVAADVPLELRYMGRLYRQALGRIAPELTAIAWDRTGVAPRRPWPLHALGRYGRRFGLLPRSRPALDHARDLRETAGAWMSEILLSPRSLEHGYLRAPYVHEIVEQHRSGRADRTAELGMALTIELWRRAFVDRDEVPVPPIQA